MEAHVTSNLIAASAGTGKTYKLASRFISLLALGYPAEKLIALTFTRNAAGEFKSRILRDLAKGASSEKDAEELTRRIRSTLSGDGRDVPLCPQIADTLPLGQLRYRKLLRELVGKLALLNLSTLDSFFSKLVASNCLELGYPSVVQMDDAELARARRDALGNLLELRPEDEDGLLELSIPLIEESKKNTLAALEENVQAFYTGLYQDAKAPEIWGALEVFGVAEPRALATIREHLADSPEEAEDFLPRFIEEQQRVIEDLAAATEASAGKLGGALGDALRLVDKLKRYLGLEKCNDKPDCSVKTRLGKYMYGGEGAGDAALQELMAELRYTRDVAIWLPQVRKSQSVERLLSRYDARYQEDVRSTGRLVFADMPRLVADKLLNEDFGDSANIAYRLDGKLDHWMLDEFQDTAPEQWAALKVLLEEVRDSVDEEGRAGRSLFVVGDQKQSIYGWRGATPELFSFLKTDPLWQRVLQLTAQNESYRSAPAIMGEEKVAGGVRQGFVNALFRCIGERTGNADLAAFTHHRVAESNSHMPGYVRVESCSDLLPDFVDGVDKDAPPVREAMCLRMAEILTSEVDFNAGGLSAAILVRSNSEVTFICNWFRERYKDLHLPVESLADENVGSASLLGETFLHFFKWMRHPGDLFSRSMLELPLTCVGEGNQVEGVSYRPIARVIKEGESTELAWNRWRNMLETQGYAAVLMALTDLPSGAKNAPGACTTPPPARRDRAYREWLNAARSFDATGGGLDEWLLYISNLATKANPPKSCIHVMTVHKSKGAEYDVVLLPFSSPKPAYRGSSFLKRVVREGDQSRVVGVVLNPGVADKEVPSSPYCALQEMYKDEQMAEVYNVLYVAVTRAKYANYILLNSYTARGRKPQADSFSDIISHAVSMCEPPAAEVPAEDDAPMGVEWGDRRWVDRAERKKTQPVEQLPALAPPVRRRRKVSPSKVEAEHEEQEPELSAAGDAAYVPQDDAVVVDAAAFGTAVHALFEQVEWLGPEPDWMLHPHSMVEQVVAEALRTPEIRALYTRQEGQQAYNEQDIDAVRGGDWISGTIDRLVLSLRDSQVVAASIIDFKTDLRRGSSPEEQDAHLRATHCEQMKAYHSLIREAFDLPAEAVSVTLISCPRGGEAARAVRYPAAELEA